MNEGVVTLDKHGEGFTVANRRPLRQCVIRRLFVAPGLRFHAGTRLHH